jgi:amino acid transporter
VTDDDPARDTTRGGGPASGDQRHADRSYGEVVVVGALAVLGAAAVVGAPGYGILVEGNRVGPGLVPLVAGILVAMLFGAAFVEAMRGARTMQGAGGQGPAVRDGHDIFGRTREQRVRQLWIVVGLLLVTLLLVPVIGFLLAFGLFTFVVSTAVEGRPLLQAILISLVAVAAVYAIFVEFLAVPLPGGSLGLG